MELGFQVAGTSVKNTIPHNVYLIDRPMELERRSKFF